ncbi:hypothetical protein [Aquabacterium sp.]|uniref:hypothetical protein n=1 Tax=Aquabacterium sp. TaxID=1872578 RepID=UPI0035B32622
MNHYERLNITRDAPPAVVHAAYQALVASCDDGQADEGDDDPVGRADRHERRVALHTAHDVLMDAAMRAEYDAQLSDSPVDIEVPVAADVPFAGYVAAAAPGGATVQSKWVAGGLGVLVVLGLIIWLWQSFDAFNQGRRLSENFSARPVGSVEVGHEQPTVDELARMSDDELVKVLPTLDTHAPPAGAVPQRQGAAMTKPHPLDGQPLRLQTDRRLVDPLATDAQP